MYSRCRLAVLGVLVNAADAFVAPVLPNALLPQTATRIAALARENGNNYHSEDLSITMAETGQAGPSVAMLVNEDENGNGEYDNINLPLFQLAAAGSIATVLGDAGMHPVDCVKTLQQSALGIDMSVLQAINYLWTTAGVAGFYHGLMTYLASDAVGGALKFAIWEIWKQKTKDWEQRNAALLIGAALAFVGSSIVIVPGEFLKQQLQMSYYENLHQAASNIYATSGFGGFFVGYEGVLYRDIPYTMLELGLYEVLKSWISDFHSQSPKLPPSTNGDKCEKEAPIIENWEEILAAAITGGTTAFLTTPLDTIKTKMMVDPDWGMGSSFVDCLLSTVHQHGWQAVFAGALARVSWILPFTAIYLPLYDYLKRQLWKNYIMQQQLQSAATNVATEKG